jgi:hypothetical protein
MTQPSTFETFSRVLAELNTTHRAAERWPDRADLPMRVREFWTGLGISPITRSFIPAASPAADLEQIAAITSEWFEDAKTRDRWSYEPEDDPIPLRRLPPRPRLVVHNSDKTRLLLASDDGDGASLHVVEQASPRLQPLAAGYVQWVADWLLRRATRSNCAALSKNLQVQTVASCPEPEISLRTIADGVYLLPSLINCHAAVVFRDLGSYIGHVFSRPAEEQARWKQPEGFYIDLQRPKKLKIDPRDVPLAAGFRPHFDAGWGDLEGGKGVVGKLLDRWVWIRADGKLGTIRLTCDPAEGETLRAWLAEQGAKIFKAGLGYVVYNQNW